MILQNYRLIMLAKPSFLVLLAMGQTCWFIFVILNGVN